MSEHVLYVSRRSIAAAQLKLALDRVAGRDSSPAVRAIANARSRQTRENDAPKSSPVASAAQQDATTGRCAVAEPSGSRSQDLRQ